MPSTFKWVNRGSPADGFDALFGPQAELGRNVVDAALDAWENVIQDFHWPDNPDDETFEVTILLDPSDSGPGGSAVTGDDDDGKPQNGTIKIKNCAGCNGGGWWLDPTPYDSKEFRGTIFNAFAGGATPGGLAEGRHDLFTLVVAEMAHLVGMSMDENFLLEDLIDDDPPFKDTGLNDAALPVGTLWTFHGQTVDALFTDNNGCKKDGEDGAEDGDEPVHIAEPHPNNLVTHSGVTFYGVQDAGNPYFGKGVRYLPSYLDQLILKEVYKYDTGNPALKGTFYANFDPVAGDLLIRGGEAGELQADDSPIYFPTAPSDDTIVLSRQLLGGVDSLIVSVHIGTAVPGTATDNETLISAFPFSDVQSITILPGDGDDTVIFDGFGDGLIPSGGVSISELAGNDTLKIGGSHGDDPGVVLDTRLGVDTVSVGDPDAGAPIIAYTSIENVIVGTLGGEDTIIVEGTSGASAVTLDCGDDNDDIIFGQFGENLVSVNSSSPIVVDGGSGFNTLTLKDRASAANNLYTLLIPAPNSPDFLRNSDLAVDYTNISRFELLEGTGNDITHVLGTNAEETRINAGIGSDDIRVDSNGTLPGGTVDFVQGHLIVDGGVAGSLTDVDRLILTDVSDVTPDTLIVTPINIVNDAFAPNTPFFNPFGGMTYHSMNELTISMGGRRDDGNTVEVHGTAPSTETTIHTGPGNDVITVGAPNPVDLPGDRPHGASADLVQSLLLIDGQEGLDSLTVDDALETDPTTITVSTFEVGGYTGDNLFGLGGRLVFFPVVSLKLLTGSANDTIKMLATHPDAATTVAAGGGDDRIQVGNAANTLADIAGELTVFGQAHGPIGDTLTVNDQGTGIGQDYFLTGTTLGRSGAAPITYGTLETIVLNAGKFNDDFSIFGTAPSSRTFLMTGAGNDITNVGNGFGVLNDVLGRLTVNGQADFDSLVLHDEGTTADQTYFLNATPGTSSVLRAKAAKIEYLGLEGVVLNAGNFADTFEITTAHNKNLTPVALNAAFGSDVVKGPNVVNTWQLLTTDAGKLNGTWSFFSVESLQGGKDADTFGFLPGTGVSGALAGGDGADTLDYSAFNTAVNVDLAAGSATGVGSVKLGTVENVTGGPGNDRLFGDANANIIDGRGGNDILLGREGADKLLGQAGRDLLFAGIGADELKGGEGDDLLINGTTSHDGNATALDFLMAEWSSGSSYEDRIKHLKSGGGLNFGFLLNNTTNNTTVFDDGFVDVLLGEKGQDWFWAKLVAPFQDKTDTETGEKVN